MHAVIISIGDELVLGQTVDTNSAWLSAQLAARGVMTLYHQTVSDDRAATAAAIVAASHTAEIVIISGGLGPTDDDLTRPALADAMGVELIEDAASLKHIHAFFRLRKREMPARNAVQAQHPVGSTMIENTCGTAPGIKAQLHRATIYVTPGVPREMFVMFEKSIAPEIERAMVQTEGGGRVILTRKINTFGQGESDIAEKLGELMARDRNPKVGTTVSEGIVATRVRSEAADLATAQSALDDTVRQIRERLGPIVYGDEDATLAEAVIELLRQKRRTVTTAESCTGGLLGKMLTDVAGSSDVYVGGWVTYANAMKMSQLGVPEATLAAHGAVSEPTARAMAIGALRSSGADYALAVTGVAGPGGGSAEKPVGTVWLALARRTGDDASDTEALLLNLPGDRPSVRDRAAKCALQLLRFELLGASLDHLSWARRGGKV